MIAGASTPLGYLSPNNVKLQLCRLHSCNREKSSAMKSPAREPKTGARYTEFATKMRVRIESGGFEPGERLTSFQMARQRYGLSQSSVERAYALLEEEGLIERRPYSGFYVTDPRQRTRTGVIAVSENFPTNHDYYLRLLSGVRDGAHARETEVLLLHAGSRVSWDKVDGVLSFDPYAEGFLQNLPPGMPHVSLLHRAGAVPAVIADDYEGLRAAVNYLVSAGHRRIGYLTVNQVESFEGVQRQRMGGYREGLRAAGIEAPASWVYSSHEPVQAVVDNKAFGYKMMTEWLKRDFKELGLTAVLAHNDETAIGIIDALQEANLRVPGEVSVIGFDGLELTHPWCGRLTSVSVPLYEIGRRGTDFLIDWIQQPLERARELRGSAPIVLPATMQAGDSVGPPPKQK